jgi:hypothetical protein
VVSGVLLKELPILNAVIVIIPTVYYTALLRLGIPQDFQDLRIQRPTKPQLSKSEEVEEE